MIGFLSFKKVSQAFRLKLWQISIVVLRNNNIKRVARVWKAYRARTYNIRPNTRIRELEFARHSIMTLVSSLKDSKEQAASEKVHAFIVAVIDKWAIRKKH